MTLSLTSSKRKLNGCELGKFNDSLSIKPKLWNEWLLAVAVHNFSEPIWEPICHTRWQLNEPKQNRVCTREAEPHQANLNNMYVGTRLHNQGQQVLAGAILTQRNLSSLWVRLFESTLCNETVYCIQSGSGDNNASSRVILLKSWNKMQTVIPKITLSQNSSSSSIKQSNI